MKKAICILLLFVYVLTAYPGDPARAADMQPAGTAVTIRGIRLKPTMFTIDRQLILQETHKTFADDLTLFMVRFKVVDGHISESTLKKLSEYLRLYYIETKTQCVPWDVVSFGKKISTFDLIYASRDISSLREACLYCWGVRYSLSGLAKTGKALTASNKASGPLVTLQPTATPKPKFTPTPQPTKAPRITPSPDEKTALTQKMKEIRDGVKAGKIMPTLRGKLFIAVFDEHDDIILTSSSYDWTHPSFFATYITGIPEERLANGYQDADTVILVYRELSQVGTYKNGSIETGAAYAAHTMLAAIYRGKVQTYSSHVSWPPPTKTGKGSAAGTYNYKAALNDIYNAKWESLTKK